MLMHHKIHLHTMKVYNTQPGITVLLIKILIFFWPLSCVHLLQSNQHFQVIEFMDRQVSKALNYFNLS